jgi:hypothetical protein
MGRLPSATGCEHLRHTRSFPARPPPELRRWLTMEQAAEVLDLRMMVVPKFIAQPICKTDCEVRSMDDRAIEQTDLDLQAVRKEIRTVHEGRRLGSVAPNKAQSIWFSDAGEA